MVNYSEGKIYKIVDNTNGNIYIGSTTQMVCKRVACHVRNYKWHLNGNHYRVSSYNIIKNNDYYYETIEFYDCNNKNELEKRERYWIEKYKEDYGDLVVNKCRPSITSEERIAKRKEVSANHYDRSKLERSKKIKCDCGWEITNYGYNNHLQSSHHRDGMNRRYFMVLPFRQKFTKTVEKKISSIYNI